MLAIDHIVVPVSDLARAAAEVEARYGLASVEGGRHPAWGTANRIVPLGDAYVELVAVADPKTAHRATFGRWIAKGDPGRPVGWAVRTNAIEAVGRRLGLQIIRGSRVAPGGELITWRSAGVDVAARESGLPFFIQWGDGVRFPGALPANHPGGPARVKLVALTADRERVAGWLGRHELPLSITAGASQLSTVIFTQRRRDFELRI